MDKDYLDYALAIGTWTEEQKIILESLQSIFSMLDQIKSSLPQNPTENKLMGQFRITPQSGGGTSRPPAPVRGDN